ncbi:MAG: deoxyribodipyrimidine photo-lyase [Ilumatobacter sp.]
MWFRRDLRLADHPALHAAGADGAEVVPVFVVDPAFERAGAPRRAFLRDCLVALDSSLRDHGSPGLVIRHGRAVDVIPSLAEEVAIDSVLVSRDYSPFGRERDATVAHALAQQGRTLRGVGSPYAVDPGRVRKGDGDPYAVFTPFSKVWRRTGWGDRLGGLPGDIRWCSDVESDALGERPDPRCELPAAGEAAALDRWRDFVTRGRADSYDDLRDLPAVDGTSHLSPDLKWGTIHPRTMLCDLDASGSGERGHTVFSSELAWRDFYADVLFQKPHTAWRNLNPKLDAMELDTDASARAKFERWCRGETGFGIVDAGMRQLAATGWMHNRVRMITASFLVKDLHLPWQWGARWFMRNLVDGDLASNNHGWQWAAGTGTDAAPYFRVFNPSLQQERYDPDGEYVRRWVPDSVEPMVDHKAEREEALRRLRAATGG